MPGNSSSRINFQKSVQPFDRTYLKPLFLKVRCPSCQKVYRIDTRDAEKSVPEFECLSCEVVFTFDVPVTNPTDVPTRLIGPSASSMIGRPMADRLTGSDSDLMQDAKKCPKCFALNPKSVSECLKCGVIFARLDGLPLDQSMGAVPSLVKAWRDLMGDYSNLRKHFAFIDRCEDLQAIPYALKKYEDLKAVQPQDEIAQSMLQKVIMRQFSKLKTSNEDWFRRIADVPWRRVLKVSPLAISGFLMLLGLAIPSWRNLVGIGAAILFVTVGFTIFLKGRFHPQDFWE